MKISTLNSHDDTLFSWFQAAKTMVEEMNERRPRGNGKDDDDDEWKSLEEELRVFIRRHGKNDFLPDYDEDEDVENEDDEDEDDPDNYDVDETLRNSINEECEEPTEKEMQTLRDIEGEAMIEASEKQFIELKSPERMVISDHKQ